jgi:hypothetical protein
MGLYISRTEGGFQKVVFENVIDTLAGGLTLDLTGYSAAVNGMVPAGTLVGRNTITGMGKVVADPAAAGANIVVLGLTIRDVAAEYNVLTGVVTSGTARLKALPSAEFAAVAAIRTALPTIKIV